MVLESLTESRFFHPYYLLHLLLIGSYFPFREIFDMSKLSSRDTLSFGLTREQQIFACSGVFFFLSTMCDQSLHSLDLSGIPQKRKHQCFNYQYK